MSDEDSGAIIVYNNQMGCDMCLVQTYFINGDVRAVYSDMTEKFAKLILQRQRNHYQSVIVITGRTGTGKSNLAVQIARAIDPNWSIAENYIYSVGDLRRKLNRFMKDPEHTSRINLLDEGTVILSNRNVMRNDDRAIITIFETMRSLGMITIVCAPSFARLNVTIRENLTDFMIMCPDKPLIPEYSPRGFYEVFEPVYNRWTAEIWWRPLGTGIYPPLSGDLKTEYEKVKLQHQKNLTNKFVEFDDDDLMGILPTKKRGRGRPKGSKNKPKPNNDKE